MQSDQFEIENLRQQLAAAIAQIDDLHSELSISQAEKSLLAERNKSHEAILQKYVQKLKENERQIIAKNDELEAQKAEILAQNEEMLQSQEELNAQRDALEENYRRLKAANDKLTATDLILRKAYDQIADREAKIKTQNQELEAQKAEILAQNEELIQTQEELNAQREAIEENYLRLKTANEKLTTAELILRKALEKIKENESQLVAQNSLLEAQKAEILTQNEELRQTQEELLSQKELAERQSQILTIQHEKLNNSIRAALSLQKAILPSSAELSQTLGEHFVLYRPKDIVSGDLYWVEKVGERRFVACIDCTGHGVEGAFMTFIAHSLLQFFVVERGLVSPKAILESIHQELSTRLRWENSRVGYGMDMALVCLEDTDFGTQITFCGAKSDLYLLENEQTTLYRGNRKSIGALYEPNRTFEQQVIQAQSGAIVCLSSDGFMDQADANSRKLGRDGLFRLLTQSQHRPLADWEEILWQSWLEYTGIMPRRDDILVMGWRL